MDKITIHTLVWKGSPLTSLWIFFYIKFHKKISARREIFRFFIILCPDILICVQLYDLCPDVTLSVPIFFYVREIIFSITFFKVNQVFFSFSYFLICANFMFLSLKYELVKLLFKYIIVKSRFFIREDKIFFARVEN